MYNHKAKTGDKIKIVAAEFGEKYKNGDVMEVTRSNGKYTYIKAKNEYGTEYLIDEKEYEVIKEEKVMSRFKAKVGDKIKIIKVGSELYGDYKVNDVMTADRHGALYLIAIDSKGREYSLDEFEYEVITEEEKPLIDFEPKEVILTEEQKNALQKWFTMDGNLKQIIDYKLGKGFESNMFSCFNNLTIEQLSVAALRPDKIKIKEEVKYEITNPVTALEMWRDGVDVYFKKKEKEKWSKLNGGVPLQLFNNDEYGFALKVNG